MYTLIYLPACDLPKEDRIIHGFNTEQDAWKWVEDNFICQSCKKEIETYDKWVSSGKIIPQGFSEWDMEAQLAWEHENMGDSFPGCMCEWIVIPTEKYHEEISFEEIMDASGAERTTFS